LGKNIYLKGLTDSTQLYLDHQTIPVELYWLLHRYWELQQYQGILSYNNNFCRNHSME